jgi:hypothetical protein
MFWEKASGVVAGGYQGIIDSMTGDEPLRLAVDEGNQYDDYATALEAKIKDEWVQVGWVPKGHNQQIADALRNGEQVTIDDYNITGGDNGKSYGINFHIVMPKATQLERFCKKLFPDVGEGFVWFDERNHIYYNEEGEQMMSASQLEEAETGKPDMKTIAGKMAELGQLDESTITRLWEQNGNISREFGTVVHDALDFYITNQTEMQVYDDVMKGREHTARNFMNNTIGDIVDKYRKNYDIENSKTELFVRYGNYCGRIDQLKYHDENTVSIRDYKFVNELKSVKTKSYGTVKKYTVQQSLYRAILQKNGYNVLGMELHMYDGNKWDTIILKGVNIEI